jgi:hypothetical protein
MDVQLANRDNTCSSHQEGAHRQHSVQRDQAAGHMRLLELAERHNAEATQQSRTPQEGGDHIRGKQPPFGT